MDKETALQAWKRMRSEIDTDNWLFVGTINPEMVDRAIEALEDKDIDVPAKWIPVSERLPEEGHDVLITKEPFKIKGCEHEVIKAKRSVDPRSGKIEWWSPEFGALADKTVLAWMPLPKPWKGE